MTQAIIKYTVLSMLVTSLIFSFSSPKVAAQSHDDYSRETSFRLFLEASEWTLINGLNVYHQQGIDKLKEKLLYDYRVSRPIVYDDYVANNGWVLTFIAISSIPSRTTHGLNRLYKYDIDSLTYEFWVNVVSVSEDSMDKPRQVFYITSTDGQYGIRKILRESDQVILSHTVSSTDTSESIELKLPLTDDVLYLMEAWDYPNHYKGTDIPSLMEPPR